MRETHLQRQCCQAAHLVQDCNTAACPIQRVYGAAAPALRDDEAVCFPQKCARCLRRNDGLPTAQVRARVASSAAVKNKSASTCTPWILYLDIPPSDCSQYPLRLAFALPKASYLRAARCQGQQCRVRCALDASQLLTSCLKSCLPLFCACLCCAFAVDVTVTAAASPWASQNQCQRLLEDLAYKSHSLLAPAQRPLRQPVQGYGAAVQTCWQP